MKNIFIMIFLIAAAGNVNAQYTNVMISNTSEPEEVSIVINPKNTNQLVAGSNLNSVYRSADGGLNWVRNTLNSTFSVWGDPCLIVDTAQNFYYFHLTNNSSPGYFIDRMVCQKSTNAGLNWSNGTAFAFIPPKQQDKEWAVVDPRNNNIYVSWTQFDNYGSSSPTDSSIILFTRSTDGGLTWMTPVRISKKGGDCVDEDNTAEGAVPAVGPNGEVYVCWSNGGVLYFDRSTDAGLTWMDNDITITTQPGGWDYSIPGLQRCNGLPATYCDLSNGPNRGTIYINWTDQRNGTTDTDVWLIKSTNGGTNWSTVKRVNNDPAGKQQFFTWMTVDRATGYLYFVFHDRRNYTTNETDVYMARSTDGGETFDNFKVSSTPFIPSASIFFGDYNGITAYNNVVRPIWTRLAGTQLSIWTAIVDFTTGVPGNTAGQPSEYSLSQNYPNPFNPVTNIKFDVPSGKDIRMVRIIVYDAQGREVTRLMEGLLKPGNYEVAWNGAGFSSGAYFYRLTADGFSQTKKMMLIR